MTFNSYDDVIRFIEEAKSSKATELDLSKANYFFTDTMDDVVKTLSLSDIPEVVFEIDTLESLVVSGQEIQFVSPKIKNLKNLKDLNLSQNKITSLPREIWELPNLTTLYVADNQLSNISPEIGNLSNLTILDLTKNQLAVLPPEIGNLPKLAILALGRNQLLSLTPEIGKLNNLIGLDLAQNRLSTLPSEIGQLSNLVILALSNYTADYFSFPKMSHLIKIGYFPKALPSISILNIKNTFENSIKALPQEILNLKALKVLDLRNSDLDIPPEILNKVDEPQLILNYLAWFWDGKRQPLSETKMLVVGQGSVGKSSLVRRLTDNTFSSSETKTDGIAINHWQVANTQTGKNQPATLRINIWDFGGQEIMHATHKFFFTRRSLYLLVLDARLTQEENRIEYWLKIIESFGGDSPVFIVGNKTDQHPLDIDRSGLQKKYTNIVGILETSAASGAGIEELKIAIAAQVNALPHVRDALPETWFNVKNKIEELGREQNYISQEKYEEICASFQIHDETSQHILIGFLHDLGIILHFRDDPRLEALGILNPQWVTNGVYKILNSHTLFQNKGVLERKMLAAILPEHSYPANKRLFIVDMMRKFELCYDIVPEQTFLVPDLLPKDEPYIGEWQEALAFQYYYNVLPSSIVTRFIVRMNGFIHKTVWRSGVVLQKDGNTALVKADMEDKKIYIWVNGAEHTRRDFLSVIRAEFDAIHKTIIKIEAIQKVPHPEYPDLVLDYSELLQFERDNIADFPRSVDGKTVMVNVRQLLNGVRVGSEPVPIVKSAVSPTAELVKVETAPAKPAAANQSLLVKILSAVFVSLPRVVGRFALDIFGRGKDSADSTFVLLGYVLIILSALVVWGIVDVNSLRDWFAGWWRFFFPVK